MPPTPGPADPATDARPADALRAALVTRDVDRAVAVLRGGGLVGLPTETVYGLAADALDVAAVSRIFAVKGRPTDHPLIVHVAGADDLDRWSLDVPGYVHRLVAALWPGPLTVVVPRGRSAGDHVTGGQPTVGVRCPAHPVAHAVLAAFDGGLAAPSANRFGRVSPTTAQHVLDELGDRLDPARDVVLDGGPSAVGVESTILDCTGAAPRLLRSGAISAAQVLEAGGVRLLGDPAAPTDPTDPADPTDPTGRAADVPPVRAPGMLAAHYAPLAVVVLASTAGEVAAAVRAAAPGRAGLLADAAVPTPPGAVRLAAPTDTAGYARDLYAALRAADEQGLTRVVAVPPRGGALSDAVLDRLRRAAVGSRTHQPFG